MSAPFKAEAQLVELENKKHINAIISHDGDAIILGCNTLIIDNTFGKHLKAFIFERETDLEMIQQFHNHLPEMAIFLGCNYCPRLCGNSAKTVINEVLPGYLIALSKIS